MTTRKIVPPASSSRKAGPRLRLVETEMSLGDHAVKVTSLDKIIWPRGKITKGDLIEYYRNIAPVLLPYLKDRPQSLHRHPKGVTKPGFFQKDVSGLAPPWIDTVTVHSEAGDENIQQMVCNSESTLIYLANLGCIELHPWHSRLPRLDAPDYLVIDLDPSDVPFAKVIDAAIAVRKVLDKAGVVCFCKTSGATGLHIYVPLGAKYGYEQARQFAELIAGLVRGLLPETTSLVRNPEKRRRRVYIDCLQNTRSQTVVAPYSLRPTPGATVSTPLAWSEVKRGLDPTALTMKNIFSRLDKHGDLFSGILGAGIDMKVCLARLQVE